MPDKTGSFDWKAFSRKTWVVVVAGLFVPPVGILLAWLKPDWATKTKWVATGLMAVMLLGQVQSWSKGPDRERSARNTDAPQATAAAEKTSSNAPPVTSQDEVPSEKPTRDDKYGTQWASKKTGRTQPVDMTKVFEIRVGMTQERVRELLGDPHETRRGLVKASPFSPEKQTATWTYAGADKDDFIMVGLTDGVVETGGAEGWDFEKGFFGSAKEKKRIVQHYMEFLKNGGTPPFNANNPPAPGGS